MPTGIFFSMADDQYPSRTWPGLNTALIAISGASFYRSLPNKLEVGCAGKILFSTLYNSSFDSSTKYFAS